MMVNFGMKNQGHKMLEIDNNKITHIIDNNGSIKELYNKIDKLIV